MKMEDYATEERQAFINNTVEWRLAYAQRQLGTKYLCHPANRVQKRTEPKDSYDVTGMFKAVP